jgi:hypothetical protein
VRICPSVRSQVHVGWLAVLLLACGGPSTFSGASRHDVDVASTRGAPATSSPRPVPPQPPPPEPVAKLPAASDAAAAGGLNVERVLESVERAWPVGDVVVAQTQGVTEEGAWWRELVVLEGDSVAPLRKLSRGLGLDQFVRVEGVFGTWPGPVWLEVHADLTSSKRVELHRIDAKRQVSRQLGQLVGSMQTRLDAAKLVDDWLFVLYDPLAGGHRFVGTSPFPRQAPLPQAGPDCSVPFTACGLRSAESGGVELLALRCQRVPVTVTWSDRRAKPSERVFPADASFLSCDQHPDLRQAPIATDLQLKAGRPFTKSAAPVRISTTAGPLETPIDQAFVVAGRTWLVTRDGLYRQADSSSTSAQPFGSASAVSPPAPAPQSSGE